MATVSLKVINSVEAVLNSGRTLSFHQGGEDSAPTDAYDLVDDTDLTIDGEAHVVAAILPTATVHTIWDDDDDVPVDWDFFYFWADVDMWVQVIGSGSEFRYKIKAKTGFTLPGYDGIVCTAGTTAMTGGTEPTATDIDSILVGNYSGGDGNYTAVFFD